MGKDSYIPTGYSWLYSYTLEYDHLFILANNEFFGGVFDWRWWKAQAITESNLEPLAKSHCGAMGMMQIMPSTWDDLAKTIDISNPWDARDNIRAGVFYMKKLWHYWQARKIKEFRETLRFAQASYNAGMGNIRKAWKLTDSNLWADVAFHLPEITGGHARETINYVQRIEELFQDL